VEPATDQSPVGNVMLKHNLLALDGCNHSPAQMAVDGFLFGGYNCERTVIVEATVGIFHTRWRLLSYASKL
jgi:hypothetical protein